MEEDREYKYTEDYQAHRRQEKIFTGYCVTTTPSGIDRAAVPECVRSNLSRPKMNHVAPLSC